MKFRFTASLIITFLSVLTLNAQILWEISGNGLEKPSYLLGTHHLASISVLDSIKGFQNAFESCDQVTGEINVDEMLTNVSLMTQKMMLPQDSLLDVILSADDYKKLDEFFLKHTGIGAEKLKSLKPVAILTQISLLATIKGGFAVDPNMPMDFAIQKIAKEKGKTINGFETTAFQMSLLFDQDIDEQCRDLMTVVNSYDEFQNFTLKLNHFYRNYNLHELQKLMHDEKFGANIEMTEKLINKRNHNWVEQLISLLPEKSNFIAVGAGHLDGEQGVIKLLRDKGYTVTCVD